MSPLPIVLVDQDGPLASFDEAFHALCDDRGWERHSTLEQQCHRYATDCILDRKHAKLARAHVHSSRWFRELPVVAGAREGLEALAEEAEVWIASKPLDANATGRDDKAAWLAEHFGERWARRLILIPDKSLVNGAILLDDAPKRAWLGRALWSPVIFPAPWNGENSEWKGLPRWSWSNPVEDLLSYA